jgi:lysozyme family protein
MQSVEQIAEDIIAREGGFVNDPDDPGGATNHGVTIHTMRRLGLDLNKDGLVDLLDVRQLSKARARKIFLDHYYHAPGISGLPLALRASVFDMQVNAGGNAVRLLQKLLVAMGYALEVDGKIGPRTRAMSDAAFRAAPEHLADAYGIARRNYYYRLADRRPASRKFARRRDGGKGGWITRAEEFISDRYHLTEAEHSERVSSWE